MNVVGRLNQFRAEPSPPVGRRRGRALGRARTAVATAAALVAGWAGLGADTVLAAPNAPAVMYGPERILPFSGLMEPWGVAVDGAGNVYTSDAANGHVYKLSPAGVQSTLTPFDSVLNHSPQTLGAISLAADAAGDVFVAGNYRVAELQRGATAVTELTALETTPAQGPDGIAVDGHRNVFVSYYGGPNNQGAVYELPGRSSTAIKLPFNGIGGCCYYNVAVNAAGDVFAAAAAAGQVYEVKHGASQAVPVFAPAFYFPPAVAVDSLGDVFTTDNSTFTVKERRLDGTQDTLPIPLLAEAFNTALPLPTPRLTGYGLAVDARGDVFVSDIDHGRVIELPRYTCSFAHVRPRPRKPTRHTPQLRRATHGH